MIAIQFLFPVFFIGMITLVLSLLSKKGWSDLASEYEFRDSFHGERVGIISAAINGVNYNNCLLLKYNSEGFYLRPVFIFRMFHKALFIPWKEVKTVRDKKIFFTELKELVIGEPAIAFIQLKHSTFAKIENMIPSKTHFKR